MRTWLSVSVCSTPTARRRGVGDNFEIALAGAWGLEAITELLGAQAGMGKMIQVLAGATDVQGIFAALLTLGVAAIVCDALAAWLVGLATTWHKPTHPNA